MDLKKLALVGAISLMSTTAWAGCGFENTVELKSLSAGFEAWKAGTEAMGEYGSFSAELDQEFHEKQPAAFAANPLLYQIGGGANSTMIPFLNAGSIRPLDDLVAKHGQNLSPNQLIKIDAKPMAIAMMVYAQHLMYRDDILGDLGVAVATRYGEVLDAAAKIKNAGMVEYPLGGTFKSGWHLGEEFINMHLGESGAFFGDGNAATLNNAQGLATLNALTAHMDPAYLVSDSTFAQQQFQQGKIAIANLWASRAGAKDAANTLADIEVADTTAAIEGRPKKRVSSNNLSGSGFGRAPSPSTI